MVYNLGKKPRSDVTTGLKPMILLTKSFINCITVFTHIRKINFPDSSPIISAHVMYILFKMDYLLF